MGQKLGLICALLCGERMLILDEPMSGLDAQARVRLKRLLAGEECRERTVLLTTHLLNDIEGFCDRLAVLHAGSIQFVGTAEAFQRAYSSESVERAYMACIGA